MKAHTLQEALTTGRGIERSFRCEVHDDHNASASVNTVTGLWCCYACGAAGKVDENATIPDAETLLSYLKGDIEPRVYAEAWLDVFDADHPSRYWSNRFGQDTSDHFRCGTHPITAEPTYPLRDATGQVMGVVVRSEGTPKYKYPRGVPTSRTFFGDIRPNPVVVLCEGAADVMAMHQSGIPDNWTVLGCFGAGVHAPQVSILADLSPRLIVAAFDNDSAGQGASERAVASLADIAQVVVHSWAPYKDPGEWPPAERIALIEQTLASKEAA